MFTFSTISLQFTTVMMMQAFDMCENEIHFFQIFDKYKEMILIRQIYLNKFAYRYTYNLMYTDF